MSAATPALPSSLLSSERLADFRRDGYLILRGLVPAASCERMLAVTADHLQRAVAPLEYEAEVGYPGAPASLTSEGGRTVRRLRGAYDRDPAFRDWASDPALVAILTQLFEEPVSLPLAHHNCVMTKHPDFGTATGWHRDIRYWSFERPDLISVWLALGAERTENGGLSVIPGSHLLKLQAEQMDDLDFLRPEVAANQALFALGVPLLLEAGDVVLFHSGLFHAAGRNSSDRVKSSVVFAYHGESNAPRPGTRSAALPNISLPTFP
ncbi:phytanoyl-CoA dioxygenase family protein [Herbaspirillum sp. RTI4]|uniref:phytanoyl-CoA dioxygenase family protein n=1 Tax=Herbaspirillum sp. RTI4 TaxID=3048640 RepID=UPI002AB36614|nr:phytanoyl-CoA dioxygenase family protein [Herbaspirillum sp. RTI4]MDY7577788.1 phytanoyl-CoA dioxygenase family protein [Herbaspirillum sp. RTI4]MEA9980784.1 phytanoyl-CoA dioxygenase family protein [Herbaspirillum sp. RTI4]